MLWYLLQGGRHIDTAMLYLNHAPIGAAIVEAIERGVPRREIFVVTKLTDRAYSKGAAEIDALLLRFTRELRVDYLDLVLLQLEVVGCIQLLPDVPVSALKASSTHRIAKKAASDVGGVDTEALRVRRQGHEHREP